MVYNWDDKFPRGYGFTSISYLKRCDGYHKAKGGDISAAESVVNNCVSSESILSITKKYPYASVIPVIGVNKLPYALASKIELPLITDVREVCQFPRKNMSGMERFVNVPNFVGRVPSGTQYILVDDIVTQGGTISSLRKHVMSQGGNVVAVVALAYAAGSTIIKPRKENIQKLIDKFGDDIFQFLHTMGIAEDPCELTDSQIRYLLKFRYITHLSLKITAFCNNNSDRLYSYANV